MDATTVKLSDVKITGKRSDTETVMLRWEGGGWKSARNGNSLATYPTARTVQKETYPVVTRASTLTDLLYARDVIAFLAGVELSVLNHLLASDRVGVKAQRVYYQRMRIEPTV